MSVKNILKAVIWTLVFMVVGAVLFRALAHTWPGLDITIVSALIAFGGELFLLWREQRRLRAQSSSKE